MHESWEQGKNNEDAELLDGKFFGVLVVVPVPEGLCCGFEIKGLTRRPNKIESVPNIASTSSGVLCWMSMSQTTICLFYVQTRE
jgi:hypothetical protein